MRILITFLILSINLQAQQLEFSRHTEYLNTPQLQEWCNQHFKQPPYRQPIVYIDQCPLNPNILGLTRPLHQDRYMVDLNPFMPHHDPQLVLRHELVHVLQLHTQRLQSTPRYFIWEGTPYPHNYPYHQRPWEIEADQLGSGTSEPHPPQKNNNINNHNKDNNLNNLYKHIRKLIGILNIMSLLALLALQTIQRIPFNSKD